MADLRYIDLLGRERSIPTEFVSAVEPGAGETAVVLRDESGSRYPLDRTQAIMVARQAWTNHRLAVKSCDHCYWHDARPEREDCTALCCRMREAAAVVGVELQAYARPRPEPTDNPVRVAVSNWLLRHSLLFGLSRAVGVPIGLYLTALLLLLCVLAARRWYYYYTGVTETTKTSEEVI